MPLENKIIKKLESEEKVEHSEGPRIDYKKIFYKLKSIEKQNYEAGFYSRKKILRA